MADTITPPLSRMKRRHVYEPAGSCRPDLLQADRSAISAEHASPAERPEAKRNGAKHRPGQTHGVEKREMRRSIIRPSRGLKQAFARPQFLDADIRVARAYGVFRAWAWAGMHRRFRPQAQGRIGLLSRAAPYKRLTRRQRLGFVQLLAGRVGWRINPAHAPFSDGIDHSLFAFYANAAGCFRKHPRYRTGISAR
jgi:hypothetical protein